MLTVTEVTTTEAFAGLRETWNGLLMESPQNTVFLTWEWLFTWWEVYGGGKTLWILLLQEERAGCVGIAPFCLCRDRRLGFSLRTLRLLGSEEACSEYLDVITHRDFEKDVTGAVATYLKQCLTDCDVLDFHDVGDDALLAHALREIGQHGKVFYRESVETTNPYIALPESNEAYLRGLSHNRRSSIKRKEQRLARLHGYTVKKMSKVSNPAEELRSFINLHQRLWESRGLPGMFRRQRFVRFHETIASLFGERGWLALYYLNVENRPVASLYGFVYSKRFSYYQSGFDPEWRAFGVGMILLKHTILDAIGNKCLEYDFLRGETQYKFHLADRWRHTKRIMLGRRSAKLYTSLWTDALRVASRGAIKRALPRMIAERVRAMRDHWVLTER